MKKILCISAIALLFSGLSLSGAEPSTAEFLQRARQPRSTGSWGKMPGELQHRRRGQGVESFPLYFGLIIQNDRFTGQLILADSDALLISQSRVTGASTVTPLKGNLKRLNRVGLRATDLTMGFLHYNLVKELPREFLSMAPCRVLLLESSDKKETVKVYLAAEAAFPLKAEFTKKGESKPFRSLECNGFTKRGDLYFARELKLEGPGWRTRVEFDSDKVQIGLFDPKHPENVMRPLTGAQSK